MSTTHNRTTECKPEEVYSPVESPVPPPLLWVGLIHSYCVTVFGTLGNALALWCVATCTKTRRPIQVLLFSVFLPVLVICLGTMPVLTEILAALITCDPDRISETDTVNAMVLTYTLGQIEQIAIAAIAVIRAVTVWAPHRPKLGIRGAVVLLVVTCIYAILAGLVCVKVSKMKVVVDPDAVTFITILSFINRTLPALVTAASYILMIIVIQRNKRGLVASQQQARVHATTSMDTATRAMLAVFISNLVFGATHAIYHITGTQPYYIVHVVVHIVFYTHYIVDPLVYMWLNTGYREKILSSTRKVMQSLSLLCRTPGPSVTQTGATASRDHQNQHNSSTHTQDESKL